MSNDLQEKKERSIVRITNALKKKEGIDFNNIQETCVYFGSKYQYSTRDDIKTDTLEIIKHHNWDDRIDKWYLDVVSPEIIQRGKLTPSTDECICGKKGLVENCYVYYEEADKVFIVGNECVEHFTGEKKKKMLCSNCKTPHRNRKNNFCNDCRKVKKEQERKERIERNKICKICKNKKPYNQYNNCDKCIEKERKKREEIGKVCKTCKKPKPYSRYDNCYKCNMVNYSKKTKKCGVEYCNKKIDDKYDYCWNHK